MPVSDLNINIKSRLHKVDINSRRDVLSRTLQGEWATTFKGHGMEFAGFREYEYGDDASMIDWKASLRAKSTLIREFEDYKNFSVFFLFDVGNSMFFSSHGVLKCEYAAEIIYVLADAINKAGDAIGMAMATDSLKIKVKPNIGMEPLTRIKLNLLNIENYGGVFDFNKALLSSKAFLGDKGVIFIVSDFFNLPESWERYVHMLSEDYELIALVIRDPRDRFIPEGAGQLMLKDPVSGDNLYVDTKKIRVAYNKRIIEQEEYLSNVFKRSKGDYLLLSTDDDDYVTKFVNFFQLRGKRQF
ncbi:DUF58 domain-containing protein [Candidatus Woesearchaeota archaeon]|nr:DUF58 domain-containing protein [Candidatus Woesearchaeota archaeon]